MNCDQKCDEQREQAAMDKDQRKVSHEYLDGIREGREYLKRFNPDISEMHELLENINSCLRKGFSKPVADGWRGERDFWKLQIKKGN